MKRKVINRTNVFEFVQQAGDSGVTADEVVKHFGDRFYSTVTARLTDLKIAGQIRRTYEWRRTRRGRDAQVLVVASASRMFAD